MERRLARGFSRLAGGILLLSLAAVWGSLLTWSAADPSLTHGTGRDTHNALGGFGAIIADGLVQALGLACPLALLGPMFLGLALLRVDEPGRILGSALHQVVGVVAAAAAMGLMPAPANWPLHHGLGGLVGDGLVRLGDWMGVRGGNGGLPLVCLLGLAAISFMSLARACGAFPGRPRLARGVPFGGSLQIGRVEPVLPASAAATWPVAAPDLDREAAEEETSRAIAARFAPGRTARPSPGVPRVLAGTMAEVRGRREPPQVLLSDLLPGEAFRSSAASLPMALGVATGGEAVIADLAIVAPLLLAGGAGAGTRAALHAVLLSLLRRQTPETCRVILIDPARTTFSRFEGIPHLAAPVVTDARRVTAALDYAAVEAMERRKRLALLEVQTIAAFNRQVAAARRSSETLGRAVQTGFDDLTGRPTLERQLIAAETLPSLVVMIAELADLAGADIAGVEASAMRLCTASPGLGVHLVTAATVPCRAGLIGTIAAHANGRAGLAMTSVLDSRAVLGEAGAENLGPGDMIWRPRGEPAVRLRAPFVPPEEVDAIARFIRAQGSHGGGLTL